MSAIPKFKPRPIRPTRRLPHGDAGRVQPLVLILVIVLLAVAGGLFWYSRTAGDRPTAENDSEIRLSESTQRALQRLRAPVEVRFYSLLGEEHTPDSLHAFSKRVERLLSAYAREAGGKLTVTTLDARSAESMDAASADGIKAFNLAQGDPCYLGVAVVREDHKESLPRITPEWEQALEADLTRAILRVTGAEAIADRAASASPAELDIAEEVKRAVPNLASLPLDQGRQILRERALKELTAAATDMQNQIQQAKQRLDAARSSGSEAEQKAAIEQMRQAQTAQAQRLQEFSARLDAQMTALERLKDEAPGAP